MRFQLTFVSVVSACVEPSFWGLPDFTDVRDELRDRGFAFVRGANFSSPRAFQDWSSNLALPFDYTSGYNNRTTLSEDAQLVYNTGSEPPEHHVRLHTEMCYSDVFPRYIGFACFNLDLRNQGDRFDGATTLASNGEVERLLAGATVKKFMAHGTRFRMRMYDDEAEDRPPTAGGSWQGSFGTREKAALLRVCAASNRTCTFRGASVDVEHTLPSYLDYHGTPIFRPCLGSLGGWWEQDAFPSTPPAERPFYSSWGNGENFTWDEMQDVEVAAKKSKKRICWQKGDAVIVDNLRVSHGREPYHGVRELGVVLLGRLQLVSDRIMEGMKGDDEKCFEGECYE